jgi:hypothetical protein
MIACVKLYVLQRILRTWQTKLIEGIPASPTHGLVVTCHAVISVSIDGCHFAFPQTQNLLPARAMMCYMCIFIVPEISDTDIK